MANSILFVCRANVCRSPLLAYAFQAALPAEVLPAFRITSMGTDAHPGAEICTGVGELIAAKDAGRSFADSHRSSRAVRSRVERHQLIITASLRERTALAQLSPATRGQTFTIKEAVALGEGVAAFEHVDQNRAAAAYAALLAARRGLVEPQRRRGLLSRSDSEPFDVPDVHLMSQRKHVGALPGIRATAETFAQQFLRYLSATR